MQDCTEQYAFQPVSFHFSLIELLLEKKNLCLAGMCVRSASIESTNFGGEIGNIIM